MYIHYIQRKEVTEPLACSAPKPRNKNEKKKKKMINGNPPNKRQIGIFLQNPSVVSSCRFRVSHGRCKFAASPEEDDGTSFPQLARLREPEKRGIIKDRERIKRGERERKRERRRGINVVIASCRLWLSFPFIGGRPYHRGRPEQGRIIS